MALGLFLALFLISPATFGEVDCSSKDLGKSIYTEARQKIIRMKTWDYTTCKRIESPVDKFQRLISDQCGAEVSNYVYDTVTDKIDRLCYLKQAALIFASQTKTSRSTPKDLLNKLAEEKFTLSDLGYTQDEFEGIARRYEENYETIKKLDNQRRDIWIRQTAINNEQLYVNRIEGRLNVEPQLDRIEDFYKIRRRGRGPVEKKKGYADPKKCEYRNFSHKLKGKKVRDQKSSSWCAHYSVADFLSFFTENGDVFSPASSAMTYNDREPRSNSNILHRGVVSLSDQLNLIGSNGICKESDFPFVSVVSKMDPVEIGAFKKRIGFVGSDFEFSRGILDYKLNKKLSINSSRLQSAMLAYNRKCRQPLDIPLKLSVKKKESGFTYSGGKLVNTPENIITEIDAALDNYHPTLIAYNADVLKEGSPYRNRLESELNHASVIIGRKYDPVNKTCNYIVRNSWGERACKEYAKNYDCDANGNVLIPRNDILFSAGEVVVPELYERSPVDIDPPRPFSIDVKK